MKTAKKLLVILVKKLDYASAIAVRLTQLTGKSKVPIHPKHFLSRRPWFTEYLSKKDIVLDLGSGNGQNAIKAAKIAKKIVGLEYDQTLISIAVKIAVARRIKNVKFVKTDLEKKINYKNNSFDKIIFLDVLEHLANRDQILGEIKRILKSDGLLFLGVPNNETSWKKIQRSVGVCSYSDPDHKIEYSENQIRRYLKKHKFEIIAFGYGKFDTPFRGMFDIIGSISIPIYKKITKWREEKAKKNPIEASGFEIVAQNIK